MKTSSRLIALVGGLLVFGAGFGIGERSGPIRSVEKSDVNNDGYEDFIVFNKDSTPMYFIQRKDGSYDVANLTVSNGIEFLESKDKIYDFHGNSWNKN